MARLQAVIHAAQAVEAQEGHCPTVHQGLHMHVQGMQWAVQQCDKGLELELDVYPRMAACLCVQLGEFREFVMSLHDSVTQG